MGSWDRKKVSTLDGGRRGSYFDELSAKAKAILDTEDIQLPTGELLESGGRLSPNTRSDKELLAEMEGDAKAGDVIMNCMLRGWVIHPD
jgi:hypothetical protein